MGDMAQYLIEATPTPEPSPEPTIDPGMLPTDEDLFPEDF